MNEPTRSRVGRAGIKVLSTQGALGDDGVPPKRTRMVGRITNTQKAWDIIPFSLSAYRRRQSLAGKGHGRSDPNFFGLIIKTTKMWFTPPPPGI